MPIAKSIEEARAWCEDARKLLDIGIFKGSERRDLKALNSQISKLLADLKGGIPGPSFDFYSEMYRTYAGQLKVILDSTSYRTESDRQEAVVETGGQLRGLRDDLKRLAEAKQQYDSLFEPARRWLAILKATPHANTVNLERQLKAARELAEKQPPDFTLAATELSNFDANARSVKNEAQRIQTLRLQQLEKQAEYEELLDQKVRLVEDLLGLPGIRSEIELRQNLIKEAKGLASQLDYKAAIAKLQLVPPSGDLAMQAGTAVSRARELPGVEAAHDTCKRAIVSLRSLAVRTEIDEAAAKVVAALDGIIESPTHRDLYVEELRLLASTLTERATQLGELKRDIEEKLRLSTENVHALAEHAGSEVQAPYLLRLERLRAAYTARRYDESVGPAAQLQLDTRQAAEAARVAAQDWARRRGDVQGLLSQCELFLDCPLARGEGVRLKGSLSSLEALATGTQKDPDAAIQRLDLLAETVRVVKETIVDPYHEVDSVRGTADREVQSKITTVQSAINDLRLAVAEARQLAGDVSPQGREAPLSFDEKLASVRERWETLKDQALCVDELKHDEVLSDLAELQRAVENAGTEEGLVETVSTQKQGEQRQAFDEKWESVQTLVYQLAAYEVDHSAKAQKTAAAILIAAPQDYLEALTKLEQLERSVRSELETSQHNHERLQSGVQERFDEVLRRINGLEVAVNTELSKSESWLDKLKKHEPPFKELFDTFRKEHSDLGTMITSTNRKTLSMGQMALDDLAFRVEELAQRMQQMGPDMANFQGVKEAADDLENRLKDTKKFQPYVPKRWELLSATFKELKKGLGGQLPLDSMAKLRQFRADLSKAEDDATLAKTKREAFDKELEEVKSKVGQLDRALEYTKSLAGRLKTLEDMSKTEAKEDEATTQLKQLDAEISRTINEPEFLLAKDTEVREGALQLEQQKIQWESALKVFEKVQVPKARRAVAGEGDPTLVDQVVRMVKSAKDMAKAKNYDEALRQLNIAKQRVAEIVENPYGPTIGSRNELPKDNRVFKTVVSELNAALLAFPDVIEKLADGSETLDEDALSKVRALVQTLSVDVDAAAFDGAIAKLANKETKQNDRRTEREAALAIVRRYQTMLNKDPALVRLIENPIETKKIPVKMSSLYYALNRLQGNLSRCTK